MKLNIGCGKKIMKGYINLDLFKEEGVDVIHNLNVYPYPFKDNTFNKIIADNVMEHLDEPVNFCEELWRIGKNKGKIIIETPHFSSGVASWSDLTHKRTFSSYSFDNYYIDEEINKEKTTFEIYRKMRFKCKTYIKFGRIYKLIGIEFIANINQKIYENFWSYLFPARGITFYLEVVK